MPGHELPPYARVEEYEVKRTLGQGGFGITYLAWDRKLDGAVALKEYFPASYARRRRNNKVMPARRESSETFQWGLNRFLDEARAIHRLSHDNVVHVRRHFEANGTAYLAMEHVEGDSLESILEERRTLKPSEWRPILDGLLNGLQHVHKSGYLHRDVKPENIVIRDEGGSPVLIDFGSARREQPDGQFTVVMTRAYAPLELVVADGMGGHAAGDVASRIGVRGFVENYGDRGPVRDRLRAALDQANAAIAEDLDRNRAHTGMGTTIVATAITSDGLKWISVGDSALYLYRDGRIERLNDDHSMRPVLARWEKEDPVFASTLNPNELRSVVMGRRIPQTDLSEEPWKLRAGDIVVLAADGLETLSEKEVARVIADHRDGGPPGIRRALLEALEAKQHPHQDNTTLYIAEIEADSAGTSSREPDSALEADTEPPDRVPTGIGSADKDVTR